MKTTIKILSLLLALIITLPIFTACGENGEVQEPKDLVTVQWMQGQKVLDTWLVERGSTLTEWTPEVEGATFDGWYRVPYTSPWRFNRNTVDESIRIYGKFLYYGDGTGGSDLPEWFLIGAGKGDLKNSNGWNHADSAANLGLFDPDNDGIYTITVSLYAGDMFKMDNDTTWETGALDCTVMEGYDEGTGVVKDADGNVVFKTGENNNIVVADGWNGKFEISYNVASQQIGFKFLEELPPIPDDIRLNGDFRGSDWPTNYGEDEYKFTSEDNDLWTYVWEVTSETGHEFKVYNNTASTWYPGGFGDNLKVTKPGTYTVTFRISTGEIVVTDADDNKVDVGFVGGGMGGGNTYVPENDTVVHFVPNESWLVDGARFAVYYWKTSDTNDNNWVSMEAGNNGVYSATIPAGYGNVIFVRMNPASSDNGWNPADVTDDNKIVWNQTEDLGIQASGANYFVMYADAMDKADGKGDTGAWGTDATVPTRPSQGGNNPSDSNGPALTETITVYFENNWLWTNVSCHYWGGEGFVGTEWPGQAMTKVGTRDGYDVYSIELPVGVTGFMFTGNKNKEPYDVDKSPDIPTSAIAGVNAWKMDWADGNLVVGFTYDPNSTQEPVETDAYYLAGWLNGKDYEGTNYKFVDGKLTVKFNSGEHYVYLTTGAGQRLMTKAYVSGSIGTFVTDGDNKMLVPGGIDLVFTLVVNADGSVTLSYEVADLTEHTYTIAGSSNNAQANASDVLLGTAWAPTLAANDLVYDSTTGLFTKSFTNETAANIEFAFKIVTDYSWGNPNYGASNVVAGDVEVTTNNDGNAIVVVPAGKTLTISFNGQNKNITLTLE